MTGLVTLRRLGGAPLLLALITTLGLLGCSFHNKPYRMKRPHPDATPEPIDDLSISDVPHHGHSVRVVSTLKGVETITTGELLALTGTGVILLPTHEGIEVGGDCPTLISAKKLRSIEVLDTGHKTSYLLVAGSSAGVTGLTISNGLFSLLTAPVTLAVGGLWVWELLAEHSVTRRAITRDIVRFARYPSSFDFSAFSDCSLEEGVADFKAPKPIDPDGLQTRGVTDHFELRFGLMGRRSSLISSEYEDVNTQQGPYKGLFGSSVQPGGFIEGLFHIGARLSVSLTIEAASPTESRFEVLSPQDSGEESTTGFLTQDIFSYQAGVEVVALRGSSYHGLIQLGALFDGYTYAHLLKRTSLDVMRPYLGLGLRLEGPMKGHLIALQLSLESDEYISTDTHFVDLRTPRVTSLKWALVF